MGELVFTGDRWIRSGLNVPLENLMTRFYVAAALATYPTNGATLAFGIPQGGLEVTSTNDGPIDRTLAPVESVTILTSEKVHVELAPIDTRELIPGESSGAILGVLFTNTYVSELRIDSLICQMVGFNPDGASRSQLDSQIDSLQLYQNIDNDPTSISPEDLRIAGGLLVEGTVVFNTGGIEAAGSGGTVALSVVAWMNAANSKNGNLINFSLAEPDDIFTDQPVSVEGSFPLFNTEPFVVNAFPAASVGVYTDDFSTLFGGETDRVVLEFSLPSNGYSDDRLKTIHLMDFGSLKNSDALAGMKLWLDSGAKGLSIDDNLVAEFVDRSSHWEADNLNVELSGFATHFIVTVDISNGQFDAGTIDLRIPVGGVQCRSGMNGPDDDAVGNDEPFVLFPSDRVTAISIPEGSRSLSPGSVGNSILSFALYNGYHGQDQQLQAITLTNMSLSQSDLLWSDYELGQVSLFLDNSQTAEVSDDQLLATGYFSDGRLQLAGLDVILPAESLSYFSVLADVPLDLIDSDSLAAGIATPTDLVFEGSVNINGDLPLTRDGYLIADGSIRDQYELLPLAPQTLSPGDTASVLLAFKPARNGDQTDFLTSVSIENRQDADTSDFSSLKLWLDQEGDGVWQASDSYLGEFTWSGSGWSIGSLNLSIGTEPPVLMVVADLSPTATPDVAFEAVIPIDGCQSQSHNDGPLDGAVSSGTIFTISNSGLRIAYAPLAETYSVGQSIAVRVTATNLLAVPIDEVYGQVVSLSDPSTVTLEGGFFGPVSLAPGESSEFSFDYTAVAQGENYWQLRAVAPNIPDSSAIVQTNIVSIQNPPDMVEVELVNSIPTSVTRGQRHVFPLSLVIAHPDTSSATASLRMDSLVLTVQDGAGLSIGADAAFSRMVLSAGYTNLTVLESIPASSAVTLLFDEPVVLAPGQQQNFSLLVDIDSLASATEFMLAVTDAEAIKLVDNNAGQTVPLDASIVFPLQTASCRIDDPSQLMATWYVQRLSSQVNLGQVDVPLVCIKLRHPGSVGSSQIQLTSLSMVLADSLSNLIEPGLVVDRIRLKRLESVIGEITNILPGTDTIEIQLSSPVTLSPDETDSIGVVAWIKDSSPHSGFGMIIPDSTAFVVRDLSSGSLLQTATDSSVLATGSVFPMNSGQTVFKLPASDPELCLTSALPVSVVGGQDTLALIDLSFAYPVTDDYSSAMLHSLLVTVLDSLGAPIDPDRLFDRIGYCEAGGSVEYQSFVELQGGAALFRLGDHGLSLDPGDTLDLSLVADIEADAPYDHFVLNIGSFDALTICDATDTTQELEATTMLDCSVEVPFLSEATNIFLPAGQPLISAQALPVQVAFAGQTGLTIFEEKLSYASSTVQGEIAFGGMQGRSLERSRSGLSSANMRDVFEALYLMIDDEVAAADSALSGDSLNIILDEEYILTRGDSCRISIVCDLKSDAVLGNYLFQFDDSTFMQISDYNLATEIFPKVLGDDYPLVSAELSVTAAGLERSFTNYPNPF
ncbi:MAG: hypothetical protein KAU36_07680, partial [candidate division Zixibacteria bacterium]|nr:hypothetical protein [candidate division Zixibacteria bacterium]